jgi:DNA-binding beta-propeller fold protein YncE
MQFSFSRNSFMAVISVLAACQQEPAMSAATDALTLESRIALGDVAGRIDHLAVDLDRRRLFVAELGNNSVGIVDLAGGKVAHRIYQLKEPQGVGYVPGADMLYVANAGDGTVRRYRGADLSPLGTLKLGDDADNVRVDSRTSQVIVGYGSGALAVLDAASGTKAAGIRLAAHPESFQLEPNGSRIFVNVPDAKQIAVVDRATAKQVAQWGMPDAGANFPMAIDDTGDRLAVVYRKPSRLAVFDTRTGSVVAHLPTCGDADDVFFDAERRRLYVTCGEGAVDVVQQQADTYRELGRVPTIAGARTSLFVPSLDRLFVAVRATGSERAALWVFRPSAEP